MGPNAGAARHAVRSSPRVRWTTWAARLGVRASASIRTVIGRAAALARRGRATFATILGAQAGGPARPRTRCSRLCVGASACTSAWTVGALPRCRARTSHASPPRRRACCVITFLEQISIPEQISRFCCSATKTLQQTGGVQSSLLLRLGAFVEQCVRSDRHVWLLPVVFRCTA